MIETFRQFAASLLRLVQRLAAPLTVLAALLAVAAGATLIAGAPAVSALLGRADAAFSPEALDVPLLDELDGRGGLQAGLALSVAVLAAIVVFALGDAVLVRAAAGSWSGLREAWADAVRRAAPLLGIAAGAVVWAGLAAGVSYLLLGDKLDILAERAASERRSLVWLLLPSMIWIALAAPVILAADLARARVIIAERRSGAVALAWALSRVFRSVRPWLAAALALLLDAAIVTAAAIWRPLWDPRTASHVGIALLIVLVVVAARLLVHGAYVGTLGRYVAATAGAASRAR